jgi:probable phosphoglycerate mutase
MQTDPEHWWVAGAERWEEYTGRFLEGLAALAARYDGQAAAVVTHSMVLRQSLRRLFPGQPLSYCDNASVSCVTWDAGRWTLDFTGDSEHIPEGLTTYAAQRTLREHPELHYNLWFRTALHDPDTYIRFRREAWELVYGARAGFDGEGFWNVALRESERKPEALVFAMSGSRIAGVLQLNVNGYLEDNAGYIPFIFLCEPWRHKGLGVQLIGYAVLYFRALGRDRLQLRVAPTNAPALAFYEKCGFRRTDVSRGRYPLWLMEKPI